LMWDLDRNEIIQRFAETSSELKALLFPWNGIVQMYSWDVHTDLRTDSAVMNLAIVISYQLPSNLVRHLEIRPVICIIYSRS
jgi:hypothetical protein